MDPNRKKTTPSGAAWCLCLCGWLSACVAPVASRPITRPSFVYAGTHGRPRAFGGGVCTEAQPHAHRYPPSPRDAFVEEPVGLRDKRQRYAYVGRHAHRGRTCFLPGWHLHLEPPDTTLVFDEAASAWRNNDNRG